jgi:hypothetical protein
VLALAAFAVLAITPRGDSKCDPQTTFSPSPPIIGQDLGARSTDVDAAKSIILQMPDWLGLDLRDEGPAQRKNFNNLLHQLKNYSAETVLAAIKATEASNHNSWMNGFVIGIYMSKVPDGKRNHKSIPRSLGPLVYDTKDKADSPLWPLAKVGDDLDLVGNADGWSSHNSRLDPAEFFRSLLEKLGPREWLIKAYPASA